MRRLGGTFSRLLDELVRERVGLAPSRRHEDAKERVLGEAMKRAGVEDEATYLALLQRDPKAFDALIADLTVPETYFFRDPSHYELLRREVLPAIVRTCGREHVIEVWSAGCATGEEPYTMAMLLEQELLAGRANVLGTDVSQRALTRARRGVYGPWSLRATDEAQRARYFERRGRDYHLSERIKQRVRFQQHSLVSGLYPLPASRAEGFDLILCRNVLIYFEPEATARTGQRLASSLCEGGFLVLGPSDPLLDIAEWCDVVTTPSGLLYRRRRSHAKARREERARSLPAPIEPPPVRVAPARLPEPASVAVVPAKNAPALPPPALRHDEAEWTQQVATLLREHGAAAAEAGARDIIETHPLSAAAHFLHASLLVDMARPADAERALRRALYLDRTLLVAAMLNATLLERSGRAGEAARAYRAVALQARQRPGDQAVAQAQGLTHAALAELAERRARALDSAVVEKGRP